MEDQGFLYSKLFKLGPVDVALINILVIGLIFLVAFIIRRLIQKHLKAVLRKATVQIEGKSYTGYRLVKQFVYVIAIILAVNSFQITNPEVSFSDFLVYKIIDVENFKFSIYHVFLIFGLFFGAKIVLNLIKLFLERKAQENPEIDSGTQYVYFQVAKYIIYTFVFLFSIQSLGVNLIILVTSAAGIFIGIGFGLQDLFRDMISGFILLLEGSIKVGDIIEINEGGIDPLVAKVLKINIRTTKIETREGNTYIIPNAKLTQEYVENWNFGSSLTRFSIPLTVEYGTDTELVKRLLKQAAFSHPKVKKNKDVFVRLLKFGHDGLEMDLIFWADQSWRIEMYKSEIRFEIDRLFREYGIKIPLPQRVVHYPDHKKPVNHEQE